MPRVTLQERQRNVTAVIWTWSGKNDYNEYTFTDGAEIKVRWVDEEVEFTDLEGAPRRSKALLYPGTQLPLYSYIYKGTLASLPAPDVNDPVKLQDSYDVLQVVKFMNTPWIKGNHTLYQAWLV